MKRLVVLAALLMVLLECFNTRTKTDVLGMLLVLVLVKWSPRVFEIRARKRMSLGSRDMLLGCRIWSPRVFEIRARKRLPGRRLYASSFRRYKTSKERKKEKERSLLLLLFTFLSVSILPVPSFFDEERERVFACILRVRRRVCPRRIDPGFLVSSLIFWPLESCIFCDKKGTTLTKTPKEGGHKTEEERVSIAKHTDTHTQRERERERERERTRERERERERERTRAEKRRIDGGRTPRETVVVSREHQTDGESFPETRARTSGETGFQARGDAIRSVDSVRLALFTL